MTEKREPSESSDLDPLFRPNSVAIIGASPDITRGGGLLWRRLCDHGYSGKKYPVSTRYAEIDGVRCYRSVSDLDDPVDLAILAVPAAGVED